MLSVNLSSSFDCHHSKRYSFLQVERLVDHDCDPTVVNNWGETALDLACRFGHLEVRKVILSAKIVGRSCLQQNLALRSRIYYFI